MTEEHPEKKKISEALKQEYKRLLEQKNTLYLQCKTCNHKFTMTQPDNKYVRYNNDTNFLVPMHDEHGKYKWIPCPKCSQTNIRRLAPPWNPSTGSHHSRPPTALEKLKTRSIIENDY